MSRTKEKYDPPFKHSHFQPLAVPLLVGFMQSALTNEWALEAWGFGIIGSGPSTLGVQAKKKTALDLSAETNPTLKPFLKSSKVNSWDKNQILSQFLEHISEPNLKPLCTERAKKEILE